MSAGGLHSLINPAKAGKNVLGVIGMLVVYEVEARVCRQRVNDCYIEQDETVV
jgi:hypothetical protein